MFRWVNAEERRKMNQQAREEAGQREYVQGFSQNLKSTLSRGLMLRMSSWATHLIKGHSPTCPIHRLSGVAETTPPFFSSKCPSLVIAPSTGNLQVAGREPFQPESYALH